MTANNLRFLQPVFDVANANRLNAGMVDFIALTDGMNIPGEFTAKEYLAFLLHINSEIEHGLMVQYLYAAYSLGGSDIGQKYQEQVRQWQEIILGIAKEEMGHLVTCQNVLRLIGAPLNLGRENYPWDTPFYPFPFMLERVSLDSLAKYVFAESPNGWIDSSDPIAVEIKKKIANVTHDPHRVGALFDVMIKLMTDDEVIPEDLFQTSSYVFQAKQSEWQRGYSGGDRGNSTGANPTGTPNVLVEALLSRDNAVQALKDISEQGEAANASPGDTGSHFSRFLRIYKELREITGKEGSKWSPSRPVAFNPTIDPVPGGTMGPLRDQITNPVAIAWAELFNLRYRMLLNFLIHSFQLDNANNSQGGMAARGMIIGATFGEMYNLRSIANVLVRTPLTVKDKKTFAGPPFMMPYTLDLPMGERNRWLQHIELLTASQAIVKMITESDQKEHETYLHALQAVDQKLLEQMHEITGKANQQSLNYEIN